MAHVPEISDLMSSLRSVEPLSAVSLDEISLQPLQTLPHSEVYRVRIESHDVGFILKVAGAADIADLARRERRFYRFVAPQLPAGLTPGCIAEKDVGSTGWLLIEDLSGTHGPVARDGIPTQHQSRSFVAALAELHGRTYRRPDVLDAWSRVEADLRIGTLGERLSAFAANLRAFIGASGPSLDDRTMFFLDHALPFRELLRAEPFLDEAIVHGDAHYANALYSDSAAACLIDWGMPMRAFGEIDVAHAIAMNLPPDVRRRREPMLRTHYLERLAARGIAQTMEDFLDRYRLGVLYAFASPVAWWRSGVPERVWRPALANLVDAAEDLGLDE